MDVVISAIITTCLAILGLGVYALWFIFDLLKEDKKMDQKRKERYRGDDRSS